MLEQGRTHFGKLEIERQAAGQCAAQQGIPLGFACLALVAKLFEARQIGVLHPCGQTGTLGIGSGFLPIDPFHLVEWRRGHFADLRRGQRLQRRQHVAGIQVATAEVGVDRIGISQLLGIAELADLFGQAGQLDLAQAETVIAAGIGIRHDPGRVAGASQHHRTGGLVEHVAADLAAIGRTVAHTDRHAPDALRIAAAADRQIAALAQMQHGLAVLLLQLGLHVRHAGLVEETVERVLERIALARGRGDRANQISGHGVTELVLLDICLHALLEGLLADIVLEHGDHTCTLLVGDAIERGLDVAIAGDRLTDHARADQAVAAHRALHATHAVEIGTVFRMHLHRHLLLHPGGECLVEPDVVPPFQRHRVAGPLMRQLMRGDVERTLYVARRRILVEQQQPVAEGDQTGVLHRTGGEVRRGKYVELVPRIAEAVIVLQRMDDARSFAEYMRHAMRLARGGNAAQWQRGGAIGVRRNVRPLGDIPRTHAECHQIGRQRQRLCKRQRLPTVAGRHFFHLLGIRHRRVGRGYRQADIERRLEAGLVEAREGEARADRLHLRHRIRLALGADLVQTLQLGVERRGVVEAQRQLLRLQRAAEIDPHHTGLRIHRDVLADMNLAGGIGDFNLRHLQLVTVQPQVVRCLGQLDLDRGGAGKVLLRRIDLERQLVRLRHRPARQAPLRRMVGAGGKRCATTGSKRGKQEWANETAHGGFPWDESKRSR